MTRGTFVLASFACVSGVANAAVVNYNQNFEGWKAAVGQTYTTIDFVGLAPGTIVTNQYEDLGVLFTDPTSNIVEEYSPDGFLQDGWGIDSNGSLELTFTGQVMYAVGAHLGGINNIQLFSGGALIGQGSLTIPDGQKFAGLISSIGFDRVIIKPFFELGQVYTDNLYFSPIPAPATFAIIASMLAVRRRRAR